MIKVMIFLRSTIFNLLFYGLNIIACLLCLPGLLLSDKGLFVIIRTYLKTIYYLEKYILGLDYEVRGAENLPSHDSYIVAAKHQSQYETFKLHLLFLNPAIVLKKELLSIPIWGKFLSRIKPIAIDRSKGKKAMNQIEDAAAQIKEQNRQIVIFPQGTRVYPWQTAKDKPYKAGIARIQARTEMPIIPLALNSGLFWPRSGWIKYPGKVIFEFQPAIKPDENRKNILKQVEQIVESRSEALQAEAMTKAPYLPAYPNKKSPESKTVS